MAVKEVPVASFTNEDNPWLAKHPLETNGQFANLEFTSLVKEATGVKSFGVGAAEIGCITRSIRGSVWKNVTNHFNIYVSWRPKTEDSQYYHPKWDQRW